eukprot:3812366-Alexandrium_andersonii.AAC.1
MLDIFRAHAKRMNDPLAIAKGKRASLPLRVLGSGGDFQPLRRIRILPGAAAPAAALASLETYFCSIDWVTDGECRAAWIELL